MRTSLSKILVLAIVLVAIPNSVQADMPPNADPLCSFAAPYPGMTPYQFCWGAFSGNDTGLQSDIISLLSGYAPGSWTFAGKTEEGSASGPFNTWGTDVKTGTLTFKTPVSSSFAILLKAANQFSIYYYAFPFDAGSMPPLPASVDFNTYGVNQANPAGNVNGLSHASLYLGPQTVVPEPSTFILLGTGLLLLFGVERRRRMA
jgi:hypothetical protein